MQTSGTYLGAGIDENGDVALLRVGSGSFIQEGEGAVSGPAQDKLRENVSVADFATDRLVADGNIDDTPAILRAIDTISRVSGTKGNVRLHFPRPQPGKFYKLTQRLDLTNLYNVTFEAEANYNFQDVFTGGAPDGDTALLHWYGAVDETMILLDTSYGLTFNNITLNARETAQIGYALGHAANSPSNCKFITLNDCGVKYSEIGVKCGGNIAAAQDIFPVYINRLTVQHNKSAGLMINSGNAGVYVNGFAAFGNGSDPISGVKGSHIYQAAGEVEVYSYGSDDFGLPAVDALVVVDAGTLRLYGWADDVGPMLLDAGGSGINGIELHMRHYDGSMTNVNTPKSIRYGGAGPLVLIACKLYNNVEILSGNNSPVIDMGVVFVEPSAHYIGDLAELVFRAGRGFAISQPATSINRMDLVSPNQLVRARMDADQGNGGVYFGAATTHPLFLMSGGVARLYMQANGDMDFQSTHINMPNLPTADPHVVGGLWNNAGILAASAG